MLTVWCRYSDWQSNNVNMAIYYCPWNFRKTLQLVCYIH